ncbi:hypothetical protein OEZ85_000351 [Tetradesmus obliquus]|uniref:JmjC domain-containing protein n=1 Tax=Tetradesmus obliquus TaxID=3088 RepID=A0ABY8UTH5_TETOB|nr:hypothetical protein OEZ85_000351 [Tetradesmus obliquus]
MLQWNSRPHCHVRCARTNVYQPPRACQGISPEQAQRLLDGECLPLHGSSLTQHIHPPPAVQSVDLVRPVLRDANAVFGSAAAHPASASAAAGLGGAGAGVAAAGGMGEGSAGEAAAAAAAAAALGEGFGGAAGRHLIHLEIKPADTLHLQMTPKDCYTDFRTAPGGAASWLYVLHGSKVLLLLPPTQRNRRLFLTWRGVTRAAQGQENLLAECFLADYAEGAVKVEVKASQALVIPCGWFYASATPSDSLAVGCFFWHPYALGDAARAQQMELALKIRPPRFAGPARQLLWYAGVHYAKQLRERLGLAAFAKRRPAGSVDAARASRSEASLNQQQLREQQQRLSPYLRGSSAGAGVGAALQRGAAGQRGTPPLLGLTQQQQQQQQQLEGSSGGVLGSPMSSAAAAAAARGKRGRQEMDALCLGEAAVPVGPAAAAAAAGGGGAAAGGLKRLRANTGKPVTPHRAGLPGSQQQQQQQQQGNLPSHSGGTTPRSTNRSAAAAAAFGPGGGGQQQQRRQQQQQWRSPQRQLPGGRHNVVNDDDDEGECHTSPDVGSEQQQQRRKSPDSSSAGSHAVSAAAAAAPTALPQLQQQQQQQPLQQQQQPAPMLPPPPTKLSAWELAELPILLEYLSEQVAEKSAELPLGMTDPEWLLQQMEESVAAARAKEDGDAAGRAALNTNINTAVAAREVQQVQEQQQLTPAEAAAAAARWSEGCGPLMLQPLAPDEMPAGFGEQWRAAQALLRSSGLVGFGAGAGVDAAGQPHEATTEVVGETDPDAGSVGTASWDNRSAGSIGGSRGAAAAAAAGGGGRGRGGSAAAAGDAAAAGIGSGGHVRGQVKRGPSGSVPAGVMQAKSLKRQQVMKGIGMKR